MAHLNLITCEGVWNQVNGTYPQRRVIFTDLVPTKNAIEVNPVPIFNRTLAIGADGEDVVSLQRILSEKGFLTMPSGVPYGYFGKLTRTAIAKYQKSVGIPPIGIFGELTKTRLILELQSAPAIPDTGSNEQLIAQNSGEKIPDTDKNISASSSLFIQYIKNAYATPVDGIITSFLLVSILGIVSKIFW